MLSKEVKKELKTQEVMYRSVAQPVDDIHPNKNILTNIGEPVGSNKPKPMAFIKSHQELDISVSNPWLNTIQMIT